MKKMILLFVCLVGVFSIHAQDIQQLYLQTVVTQYFVNNKSEIWS